jgi:hypothetical protein
MKYSGLRARVRALEAQLGTSVNKIVITGGLPPEESKPADPPPVASDQKPKPTAE